MALTVLNSPVPTMALKSNQNGRIIQWGTFAFTTTALTGEIPVSGMRVADLVLVSPAGAMASLASIQSSIGSIAATTSISVVLPFAGTITAIKFTTATALSVDTTNIYDFGVLDKTHTKTLVDRTAATNSTLTTGGRALVAYTPLALGLTATAADLVVTAGTVLQFLVTKGASPATLTECTLHIEYTAPDEQVYCDETTNASGQITIPSTSSLTMTRVAGTPTSGLKCNYLIFGR